MTDTSELRSVNAWRTALGLLPVPLRDDSQKAERYVLLNGNAGNFCLDLVGCVDRSSQCAAAWSCDVGHYITYRDDSIIVNRWDNNGPEERYSHRSILARLHDFHRHLEKTSPDRSRGIVAHVLRIFRQIRAALSEEADGIRSLRVLLHLLASAATKNYRLTDDNISIWGLTPDILDSSRPISDATWSTLYNDLRGVGRYSVLPPDFELVLRHASGAIFQDAHLEVELSPSYWLPGFERPAVVYEKATSKDAGIFFTPPALARTLAEEAIRSIPKGQEQPLVLFDPACGSGELLKEVLRLLQLTDCTGKIRVIGWGKSPASVDMARFVLAWEQRSWTPGQIEITISQHDSLLAPEWPKSVDVLVMNPPFRAWNLLDPTEQGAVTRLLGASNKPNLAMAFAARAVASLSCSGVLAMITPNSLLEAKSGNTLRTNLAELLNPQLIGRLGDQTIFARALVDAGLYVGSRKKTPASVSAVLWVDSKPNSLGRALRGLRKWRGAESEPLIEDGFSVYQREDIGTSSAPWIARGYEAWKSHECMSSHSKMIPAKKVFDIKQGVRLGNDVFVVSADYINSLPKRERRFFRPAVMNMSIADGKLNDRYHVFYPYTVGLPGLHHEVELAEYVPTYYNGLLLPTKSKLVARKSLEKAQLNWWDLIWHRSWQEDLKPKLVSKYFGGARSFACDENGQFVVVVGNAWLLRRGTIRRGITEKEVHLAMLAFLNSEIAAGLLEYVSVQVSGGQWDLSNKYLADLPIPDLSKLKDSDVEALVHMGGKIMNGSVEHWPSLSGVILSMLNR